jgi:hypothetical protein
LADHKNRNCQASPINKARLLHASSAALSTLVVLAVVRRCSCISPLAAFNGPINSAAVGHETKSEYRKTLMTGSERRSYFDFEHLLREKK